MYAFISYSVSPKSFRALLVVSDTVIASALGTIYDRNPAGFLREGVNSEEAKVIMFPSRAYALVDKNLVMERLNTVLDPEIGRSIVELNMVRGVSLDDGIVNVKIALTVAHCPLAKTLQTDVENAVRKLEGVRAVKVETTTMTRKELEELKMMLHAGTEKSFPPKSGSSVGPGIERLGRRGIRSIIAVISGKGGVGKSFVTSILASALRSSRYAGPTPHDPAP